MTTRPPLPDGYSPPKTVNGWTYAPDSNRNGHIWQDPNGPAVVGVFALAGIISIKAIDTRITGLGGSKELFKQEYEFTDNTLTPADPGVPTTTVQTVIKKAASWMNRTPPGTWRHHVIEDGAFDPPAGYVLDQYYLEERKHIVCYRRKDTPKTVSLSGCPPESDPSVETRNYLYIETWRGSGDTTIALAPWLRAHDNEKHPVIEPPDGCGIAVGIKLAREWVHEQTGRTRDCPAAGQQGLETYSN